MKRDDFEFLMTATRAIATDVAARHADDVDAQARFPHESLAAMRAAGLLSVAVPGALGGQGCSLAQQAALCAALGRGCSASAMVLAMHLIQVGCLARHGMGSAWIRGTLEALVAEQTLIASVTSEVGTYGDTRSSVCAVERDGARFSLRKAATTVSYGAHADALLVTARRAPDAAPGDQVLVYLKRGDYTLDPTSVWDTLGMRGTCSPGGNLSASGGIEQIVPGNYADSSAQDHGALLARAVGGALVGHRRRSRRSRRRVRARPGPQGAGHDAAGRDRAGAGERRVADPAAARHRVVRPRSTRCPTMPPAATNS